MYLFACRGTFFYGLAAPALLRHMVKTVGSLSPLWALYLASSNYLKNESVCALGVSFVVVHHEKPIADISSVVVRLTWMNHRPAILESTRFTEFTEQCEGRSMTCVPHLCDGFKDIHIISLAPKKLDFAVG